MAVQAEQINVSLFLDGARALPFASSTLPGGAIEANFSAQLAPGMKWDLTWYSTRQDLIGSYGSLLRFEGSMEGSLVGGKILGADGTGHLQGILQTGQSPFSLNLAIMPPGYLDIINTAGAAESRALASFHLVCFDSRTVRVPSLPPTTPSSAAAPATPSSATRSLISPVRSHQSNVADQKKMKELEKELSETKNKADHFERSLLALYEIVPHESRLTYIDWRLRNDQLTPETRVKIACSKARVVQELESTASENAKAELGDMLGFCMRLERGERPHSA
ncbi:hypothetical protein JCM10296v2_000650 [Rhodotorula toruloides]